MTGGPTAPPDQPPPDQPTPEELRAEVAAVLAGPAAAAAWRRFADQRAAGAEPDPRPLFRLLGARGLLAPAWPVDYGGRGLTARHAAAVVDALVEAGVPETLHTLSVQICGNFLLTAGSRVQQAALLPALAAGERFCTVLYSEPDVGSDLAALTTSAEPDPAGGWRLSGRKVYSVKTQCAQVGLVAARTGPGASRYQGITLFLVPLDAPGVRIRPLGSVADERFADVLLTDVPVPDSAVVGPVGGAWPLVVDALALERTGVDYHAKASTWLALWRRANPAPDAGQRVDLARHDAAIEAARLLSGRCVDQLGGGRVDPVLAATTKLWCADVARAVAWWCAEESGPDALWRWPDPAAPAGGRIEAAYREAPGLTISAGTAEMMLELLAGSGLPGLDADLAGLDAEPLARQLRHAVRTLAGNHDERDDPDEWWGALSGLDVFGLDLATGCGGLALGLPASAIACEELGRAALGHGVLDTLAAADALAAGSAGRDGSAGRGGRDGEARLRALAAGRWRAAFADLRAGRPGAVTAERVDGVLTVTDGPVVWLHRTLPTRPRPGFESLHTVDPPRSGGTPLCRGETAELVLHRDRLRRAAWLTGLATGALAHTVNRARTRRQFGRVLLDNQDVAFRLARLAARTAATRLLVDHTAARLDVAPGLGAAPADGTPAAGARAAGTLAAAAELAYAATREAMQLHGAYGMTEGAPAQRYYRAAMVACGLAGPVRGLWLAAARTEPEPPAGGAPVHPSSPYRDNTSAQTR